MIRVLNIISDTNVGGAGRVILNYLRCADRQKFETHVAVPRGSRLVPLLREAGGLVHEVDGIADRSYSRQDVRRLRRLIEEVKPDLVHTHGALSGRIAAKRCRVPAVYSRHSAFPVPAKFRYPPGRWVNKFINEHYADHIIAVSPATRDNLLEGGISSRKITVVMNGVTPVERTSPEAQKKLRAELGIGEDTVVFGIMARIEPYKGHLLLVEAARILKERGCDNFVVLAAGSGSYEETVRRAAEEAGVADQVRLLGFRSDVAALLSIMDVQLNASYGTEATSMALLEGMSLELPSVVSDYGGNPFLVEDGTSGILFPCRDSGALADAMERMIKNPQERLEMGRRGGEIFARQFTARAFARNTEQVYLDVLKGESK